jgi:DNA adenine methylase
MKYMGSKARIAKYILPIILKDRKEGQWYVEPFVGGANMIDKVDGNRIGADHHYELISMWKAIQNGWEFPLNISESDYKQAKTCKDVPPHVKGYIGFNASYSGKWWGGMARYTSPSGKVQRFDHEAHRFVTRQLHGIKGINFIHCSYQELEIPDNSIIYCDPPYKGTTKYNKQIDYEDFYAWLRIMKAKGHTIFVSEYSMPEDFTCVWSKNRRSSLTAKGGAWKEEKLFKL